MSVKPLERQQIHAMLYEYFQDIGKVQRWLREPSSEMQGFSPKHLMENGHLLYVHQIVSRAVEGIRPEYDRRQSSTLG